VCIILQRVWKNIHEGDKIKEYKIKSFLHLTEQIVIQKIPQKDTTVNKSIQVNL
jgi:hypothetical protein